MPKSSPTTSGPTFSLARIEHARGHRPRYIFTVETGRKNWTTTARAFRVATGVYVWIESNGPDGATINGTGDGDLDARLHRAIRAYLRDSPAALRSAA